jgi:RNase adaptor protein for sRNA GlmZ degradation
MELVILYGPPGVGKLTVAQALAERTGYKVFHNHLTTDLVTSLFPFGSESMLRLTMKYRYDMLGEAARAGLDGVIHTFVYARGTDDGFMQGLIDAVEPHGGRVTLALLTCDPDVLMERVVAESRSAHGKLRDQEILRRLLRDEVLMEPFPHRSSLVIDNTHRSAGEVAAMIAAPLARSSATRWPSGSTARRRCGSDVCSPITSYSKQGSMGVQTSMVSVIPCPRSMVPVYAGAMTGGPSAVYVRCMMRPLCLEVKGSGW